MTPGRGANLPSASAALAGIPAGLQTYGPWSGRRQLFVKFAAEAETATIYTADALRGEIARLVARSRYHSLAIAGRDSLIEEDFLCAAFEKGVGLPVMLDHDGQRPTALWRLLPALALAQVTLDGTEGSAAVERVCESVKLAAKKHVSHAVSIVPKQGASDASLLRIVEQVHQASADTQVLVHPTVAPNGERNWLVWLEQAMAVHPDVRVQPRWQVVAAAAGVSGETGTRNARAG